MYALAVGTLLQHFVQKSGFSEILFDFIDSSCMCIALKAVLRSYAVRMQGSQSLPNCG